MNRSLDCYDLIQVVTFFAKKKNYFNIESGNADDTDARHVKKTKLSESNEFESDKQMDDYSPSLSSPSLTIPPTNAYNVESSTVEMETVLNRLTPYQTK